MADQKTPRRVGDFNPEVPTGEVLDGIANIDVTLYGVEFDARKGKNGPYILAIMKIARDGDLAHASLFHTGSPVVVERLCAMFDISVEELNTLLSRNQQPAIADGVFPVLAKFTRVRSQNNPAQSYWTVE